MILQLTVSSIKCRYGNLQSEVMEANSHKFYFNEFFNNATVWIQSAYTWRSQAEYKGVCFAKFWWSKTMENEWN